MDELTKKDHRDIADNILKILESKDVDVADAMLICFSMGFSFAEILEAPVDALIELLSECLEFHQESMKNRMEKSLKESIKKMRDENETKG